jgi:hypothetical protein
MSVGFFLNFVKSLFYLAPLFFVAYLPKIGICKKGDTVFFVLVGLAFALAYGLYEMWYLSLCKNNPIVSLTVAEEDEKSDIFFIREWPNLLAGDNFQETIYRLDRCSTIDKRRPGLEVPFKHLFLKGFYRSFPRYLKEKVSVRGNGFMVEAEVLFLSKKDKEILFGDFYGHMGNLKANLRIIIEDAARQAGRIIKNELEERGDEYVIPIEKIVERFLNALKNGMTEGNHLFNISTYDCKVVFGSGCRRYEND